MKNLRLIFVKAFFIALGPCLFTACGNSETAATDSVHTDTAEVILQPKDSVSAPQLNSGNTDSIPELDTRAMRETLKVLDSLQLLKKK